MRGKIPKFGIVGESESGKTEIICSLIDRLKERNYSVATVKHTRGDFTLDSEGKDTWRHSQAGSELVVFSTPDESDFLLKESVELDDLVSRMDSFGDYDLLLIEGMKEESLPKIGVDGKDRSGTFIRYDDDLEEIVDSIEEWIEIYEQLPAFDCGDCGFETCEEMTRAIYEGKRKVEDCSRSDHNEEVVLKVDGEMISLGNFPAEMIKTTVRGMLSSLKGVDEDDEDIEIKIDKEDKG